MIGFCQRKTVHKAANLTFILEKKRKKSLSLNSRPNNTTQAKNQGPAVLSFIPHSKHHGVKIHRLTWLHGLVSFVRSCENHEGD